MDRPELTTSTAPRWLDDREQATWRGLLEMHALLMAQLNRDLQEDSSISTADFAVLVQLSEHEAGDMRVLELARALRWEKSRLSHQLSRMTQRGLIARSECQEDRRGAFVVLTQRGRETVEQAAPRHVEGVRRYLFDQLDDDQVGVLSDLCAAVTARLVEAGCPDSATECDAAAQA
ncbi:MarR family winged helix-turn-helix transcriptional regulator [uncultured Jatrophihabitans sp.]|uniref:MarR family winged helix-turn-helix transcriptional regulator n=1 Tax=uncultured Jatrophihabitans sp. TaxID=1610747 RepID=UPI0035CBA8C9